MSKFVGVIVGGLEIAAGAALIATGVGAPFGAMLISAGIGTLISGLGTLLSKGPLQGSVTSAKNPIAPWLILYGQNCVGGTPVYINSWGDNDKFLDMVIVVAAHSSKDVWGIRFDGQRLQIDTKAVPAGVPPSTFPAINGGTSFSPVQQTIPITGLTRSNNTVTVYLGHNIPLLTVGDFVYISGVTDHTGTVLDVNGKWQVSAIISQIFSTGSPPTSGSIIFQFVSGGEFIGELTAQSGTCKTAWPDYGRKVYMEVMTGKQTLGETFIGLLNGTPEDGTGGIIKPDNPNWTANCSLQGKTAVHVRLHYNDVYFSNGLPQISFLIHGKDDIFDPRLSPPGNAYTENAALCIADYLNQGAQYPNASPPVIGGPQWGYGALYGSEIPIAPLITAANICDERVQLAVTITEDLSSYQTEPRYACNGHFTLDRKRGEILQNLLTSCAGRLTYENGQYAIWPAAWQGGGISNSPQLQPKGSLFGSFQSAVGSGLFNTDNPSIAPQEVFPVISSMWLGNGPSTFTAPPGTGFIALGVNGFVDEDSGSWGINVSVNGVTTGVTVLCSTRCWYTSNVFPGCNAGIPIGVFGIEATPPLKVPCNPGDTVTVQYTGGLLGVGLLNPQFDANGDPAIMVGSDSLIAVPSHWTITYYEGPQVSAPSPLPTLAGPLKWIPKRSIRDLFNGVKGTYISPYNNWQSADFPPYCQDGTHGYSWSTAEYENDLNLEEDLGARLWKDIQLPFTTSYATAQRIAKIELLRCRYQGTGTIKFNMWGYQLAVLDILLFSFPFFGWTDKILEVQKHRFLLDKSPNDANGAIALSVEIDVQETDPSIYDWAPQSEQLGPQGFQQSILPATSPAQAPVFQDAYLTTGQAAAVVGTDGVARAAILMDWVAPTDGWMTNGGHVEMQYQPCPPNLEMIYAAGSPPGYASPAPDPAWITLPQPPPFASSYKTDIELDKAQWFRFQLRFVNAAGVPSPWVDFYNPALSEPPEHLIIAIQPFAFPSQISPPNTIAVNGVL